MHKVYACKKTQKKPKKKRYLKPVDTIGNCQRPVFSLAVSQHMHKITNLCSIGRRCCKIILLFTKKEKNTLETQS